MNVFSAMWNSMLRKLNQRRICKDCEGRGRWEEEVYDPSTQLTTLETSFCESCHGRGVITPDNDVDNFDLAGVGATEDDDEN